MGLRANQREDGYLKLFPWTLLGEAAEWYATLTPQSLNNWAEVEEAFLTRFFPPSKMLAAKASINAFKQNLDEPLHEAWDRFQRLLKRCHNHGLSKGEEINTFVLGLTPDWKIHLNAAAGGSMMNVNEEQGQDIIEAMVKSDRAGVVTRSQLVKQRGVLELDSTNAILAQNKLLTQQMEVLTKTIEKIASPSNQQAKVIAQPQVLATCELCGGGHPFDHCPHATSNTSNEEQAHFVSNQGRQGNFPPPPFRQNNFPNSNQGWRPNPPQGGWRNEASSSNKPPFVPLVERTSKLEDTLEKFINVSMANQQSNEAFQKNTEASIRNLETQVGQISKQLADMNNKPFSANTSSSSKEHCKAITTRSGKVVGSGIGEKLEGDEEGKERVEEEGEESKKRNESEGSCEKNEESVEKKEKIKLESQEEKNKREKKMSENKKKSKEVPQVKEVPYPLHPSRKDKARKYARFLDIFKHLQINVPFIEAMEEMPTYAKFMKDLLTKKKRFKEETVELEAGCSAIIQKSLPHKTKDPGSFTIPVTIGELPVGKALLDLGASINLMPLSMLKRIGDLQVKPTKMTLQLADRSLKFPYGVAEDVLVRVDKFVFPVDFVIMDIEEDVEVPLILRRPFMKTAKVIIDVDKGKLKVRVEDEEITFNVFEAMKHPKDKQQAFRVDVLDEVCLLRKKMTMVSPLEKALMQVDEELEDLEEEDIDKCLEDLDKFKEMPKATKNKKLHKKEFQPGQMVLLFNSRLRLFPGKLKSKWSGPFRVKEVKPYGAVELENPQDNSSWVVNGHRLKLYVGGDVKRLSTLTILQDP